MGVPKFYRFISERYPLINTKLDGKVLPTIDNLYLDMNGIIHNCVRATPGNGALDSKRYATTLSLTKSDDQIFLDVFKYIDNLVALVPPTKLLYLAVDGVAPRAKMNQQRSRRFRSAKDRADEHRKKMEEDPMYAAASIQPFDSNCITPGTHFMYKLTKALQYYITKKVTEDKQWAHLQVVLSGAETPGEGEHKIMQYIRAMRETTNMNPNTRHCVYGLDADLIMLGLVTHEPHFFILREKVDFTSFWKKKGGPRMETSLDRNIFGEFEFLSIGILREYLALEVGANGNAKLPFWDLERVTDDFVFILMLIGNDFLPNLPTLDIADGTLSVLLHLYKRALPIMGGYLTHEGKICSERLEYFFAKLGILDKIIMKAKIAERESRGKRGGAKAMSLLESDLDQVFMFTLHSGHTVPHSFSLPDLQHEAKAIREQVHDEELAILKRSYYSTKLGESFSKRGQQAVDELAQSYVEGVWWTLKYYTEGCNHWRWFYPFHYAPLASDLYDVAKKLDEYEKHKFVRDKPFLPLEQLLSVLPPVSSWCLPKPYQLLMTSPTSPIYDHYPEDFRYDLNGKRNDWEAVVLLPFVDEERLMRAVASIPLNALTDEEVQRNSHGLPTMFQYNSTWAEECISPFGTRMPSFTSHAKRQTFVLPPVSADLSFSAKLLHGTLSAASTDAVADLPTLQMLPHECRLEAVGVNIFGSPSKAQSIVLMMDFTSDKQDDTLDASQDKKPQDASLTEKRGLSVGAPVWHGYPWRAAGTIEYVVTEKLTKRVSVVSSKKRSKGAKVQEAKPTNRVQLERDSQFLLSALIIKQGIELVHPKELVGVRNEIERAQVSEDDDEDPAVVRYDPHFIRRRVVPKAVGKVSRDVDDRVSVGQEMLYVGPSNYFGHKCVIRSIQGNNVKVEFPMPLQAAKEPAFGYRVVSISGNQKWKTLSKLSSEVGMSVPIVDTFLGTIRVRMQSGKEEIDLGLGIKYISRGLYIPGYARPDERQYYSFTEKTVELLREYRKAFPHLFERIEQLKQEELKVSNGKSRGNAVYNTRDLFGNSRKCDDAARAVSTWISLQEVAKLPLVSSKAEVVTRETVEELEKHYSIVSALQTEYEVSLGAVDVEKRRREVQLHSLLSGYEGLEWSLSASVSNSANAPVEMDASGLRLGDRVVNRIGTSGVPFGLRGTVVGIHAPTSLGDGNKTAFVEVVFDEAFIGGGNLSGRCSEGRGKAVAAHGLFVIRPDKDNQYYVKHYARMAARVAVLTKKNEQGEDVKIRKAVAEASIASYAQVVRSNTSSGSGGSSTSTSGGNVQPVGKERNVDGASGNSVNVFNGLVIGGGDTGKETLDISSGAIATWMDDTMAVVTETESIDGSAFASPSFDQSEARDEEDACVRLWAELQRDARRKRGE